MVLSRWADLLRWRRWESFVNGFDPRLFRLAAVRPEEMLAEPRRLAGFFYKRLMAIRDERTTSGTTRGERDLTDSAETVRNRQNALQEKRGRFNSERRAVASRSSPCGYRFGERCLVLASSMIAYGIPMATPPRVALLPNRRSGGGV